MTSMESSIPESDLLQFGQNEMSCRQNATWRRSPRNKSEHLTSKSNWSDQANSLMGKVKG